MNKKIFWIICFIIFVGTLVFINQYLNHRDSVGIAEKTKYSSDNIADTENAQNEKDIELTQNSSSYDKSIAGEKVIQGTASNFGEIVSNSGITVLIDFYADWCPPCKKLSPLIDEVASENVDENLVFVRINVDDEASLSNEYGIQSIPTLVLIKNGKEVDRSIGYIDKEEIIEFVNQ